MRLTVFNGSPRHKGSNTKVFLDYFLEGFESVAGNGFELHYIYPFREPERLVKVFSLAEIVLVGFPLYVDAMPSGLKDFIEALKPYRGRSGNKALGFFVQSGFPEAFHSRYVERYLEKLVRRLGCGYYGTIVKGGGEGIREMPPAMTRKILERMRMLGECFGKTGEFDTKLLRKIAGPEKFGFMGRLMTRALFIPMSHMMFWNKQLKENNALEKAYDRPFEEA